MSLLDVSGWPLFGPEARGKRAKWWVVEADADGVLQDGTGQVWLRKERLQSRPFEHAIEARVLKLADRCGIEAAVGRACRWHDDGAVHFGIVVRRFLDPLHESLSLGFEELERSDETYDQENHGHHTLDRVRAALQRAEGEEPTARLLHPFAQTLLFDAWVGNGDRHPANWGIIRSRAAAVKLAPMYDPAACLGAELQDEQVGTILRTPGRLDRYVERCPSGFGNGTDVVGQPAIVALLRDWPEIRADAGRWLAQFRVAMDTFATLESDDGFTSEREELALTLLGRRLRWLEERL